MSPHVPICCHSSLSAGGRIDNCSPLALPNVPQMRRPERLRANSKRSSSSSLSTSQALAAYRPTYSAALAALSTFRTSTISESCVIPFHSNDSSNLSIKSPWQQICRCGCHRLSPFDFLIWKNQIPPRIFCFHSLPRLKALKPS